MKVLSIKLDHNPNYDNCLKRALIFAAKEEADVIAFQNVKCGSYGKIKEYLSRHGFYCEIDPRVKTKHGELLLTINHPINEEYFPDKNLTVYEFKDSVVAANAGDRVELNNYTFSNGDPKPFILVSPNEVNYSDNYILQKTVQKNTPEFNIDGALVVVL